LVWSKCTKPRLRSGIKPIAGADVLIFNSDEPENPYRLTLLAQNHKGYVTLTELVSQAYQKGQSKDGVPMLRREWIEQNHDGLIALSGAMQGDIGRALVADKKDDALHFAMYWQNLFPNRFYLELQRVGKPNEENYIVDAIELAYQLNLPVVATNDVRFIKQSDFAAHEVRVCINQGRVLDDARRPKDYTDQQYLRSAEEMQALFADIPEALENSVEIAKRCNLTLVLGKNYLPDFPTPEGMTINDLIIAESEKGLLERLQHHPVQNEAEYHERLKIELDVITQMGFSGYFMIVADFIQWAKNHGIPVGPGRGSGAGSLVAYVLKITDLDPIEFELLFERFLNPERVSMPDFDIDFCMDRRDEVIDYVADHYGRDQVSQIITYGSMAAKAVIRDVGRVLSLGYGFVDRLAKMIPMEVGITLSDALKNSPDMQQAYNNEEDVKTLIDMALILEGTARNAGKHAGGVVIAPTKLTDFSPLYCDVEGNNLVTQYDKSDVESVGLVKFDFLGLRTLTIIDWALQTIDAQNAKKGLPPVDISQIPRDDFASYDLLKKGLTTAVFQLESRGMKELIKKLLPDCFNDIIALVALFRPGPLESGMVDDYVNVKHKRKPAEYAHPILEPILEPTNGVILYQEQVMQIARELSGYTLGGADILRRAMGKKDSVEMAKQRDVFVSGAEANGVDKDIANYIFDLVDKFSGYGFNKCLIGTTLIANSNTGELKKVSEWYSQGDLNTVASLQQNYSVGENSVVDMVENGVKPVFKVTTSLGKTITATGNHPFLTVTGWKNLEDLKTEDRIAAPAHLHIEGQNVWEDYQLITLGWVLSEGNTCHPSGFYFYNNKEIVVNDFVESVSKFTNTIPRSYQRHDRNSIYEVYVGTGQDGRFKTGNVGNKYERSGARIWLESLDLINVKAPEKSLPDDIFQLKNHCVALLIGRLWSGDGFVAMKNNATPYFASSSEKLVGQLQHLLLRFGIVSRVQSKHFAYKEGRTGYTLHVLGRRSIDNFIYHIAPHLIGKDEQILFLKDYLSTVTRNSESVDTLPAEILTLLQEERQKTNLSWMEIAKQAGVSSRMFYTNNNRAKKGFRRSTILKLADFFNSEKLRQIAHPDLFWERIVCIESAGEEMTYDLEIEKTHNFVANDIIVHNSHSAAYALVAYQTAWLKAHYPAAFMAAVLSADMDNTDKIVINIEECRALNIKIIPPSINTSDFKFTVGDNGELIYGLGALKGAGEAALLDMIEERKKNGVFLNLYDLCERVDLKKFNKRVSEALIKAGALDEFNPNRAAHLAELPTALQVAEHKNKMKLAGQSDLFGLGGGDETQEESQHKTYENDVAPWSEKFKFAEEKAILGLFLTGHPIDQYADELRKLTQRNLAARIAEIVPERRSNPVRVSGLAIEIGTRQNKQGISRGFAILDDNSARLEIVAHRETYEEFKSIFTAEFRDRLLIVEGNLTMDSYLNMPILTVDKIYPIEQARKILQLTFKNEKAQFEKLAELLQTVKGGQTQVQIVYFGKNAKATLRLGEAWRVAATDELLHELRIWLGKEAVVVSY
jgi:DNA polymerase III subunit alpha